MRGKSSLEIPLILQKFPANRWQQQQKRIQSKSTLWTASASPNHKPLGEQPCPFRQRGSGRAQGHRWTCWMLPPPSPPFPLKNTRQHTDRVWASTSLGALPTPQTEGLRKINTSSVHESTQNNQPPAQVVTRDLPSHTLQQPWSVSSTNAASRFPNLHQLLTLTQRWWFPQLTARSQEEISSSVCFEPPHFIWSLWVLHEEELEESPSVYLMHSCISIDHIPA